MGLFSGLFGDPEKDAKKAYRREQERQKNLMREEQQRKVAATQEGVGFMEQSNISLGTEDEETEEERKAMLAREAMGGLML